jgi:hypothetical protein
MSICVVDDEGVAVRTPFCTFPRRAGVDGCCGVLGAVLLPIEFLVKTLEGLSEGTVVMDEVLELSLQMTFEAIEEEMKSLCPEGLWADVKRRRMRVANATI